MGGERGGGGRRGQEKMVKIQTEVDGCRWGRGRGSTKIEYPEIGYPQKLDAIISISVIRIQTVVQTGVCFC